MSRKFPVWLLILPALLFAGPIVSKPPGKLVIKPNLQSEMATTWPLAQPAVDIPPELRQHNWHDMAGGSCGYASLINVLRGAQKYQQANNIRQNYGGGSWPSSIAQACKDQHIPYVMTQDGDVKLIRWALETRRAFGIERPRGHVVAGVGFYKGQVIVLDDNHPKTYDLVSWDRFVQDFEDQGGWAFATTDEPPPPKPQINPVHNLERSLR